MKAHTLKGFTLVEMLVTVAVFMILVGVGVPSFVSAMKNSRINADYSNLVGALYLARSESVKRSGFVTVCARSTDTSCGSEWENGWLVFNDGNPGGVGTPGVIDSGEQVLAIIPEVDDRTVYAAATLQPNPSSASNMNNRPTSSRPFVRYNPRGSNNWSGGTFIICDDRGAEFSRAVNMVLTGDIRKARTDGDDSTPLDVHGNDVECP